MSETTGTMTSEIAEGLIRDGEQAQRDRIARLNEKLRVCTNQAQQMGIYAEIAAAEEIIANLGSLIRGQIGQSLYT